jgi:hypothetical protein
MKRSLAQVHIAPQQEVEFSLAKAGQQQRREHSLLESIAVREQGVEFGLRVRRRPAMSLLVGVAQLLESRARVLDVELALVDEVVEERAQSADLEVDRGGADQALISPCLKTTLP